MTAAAGCVAAAVCVLCLLLPLPPPSFPSCRSAVECRHLCLRLPALSASKLDVFVCLVLPRSWLLSHTHVIIGWVFNITFSLALVYASTWLVRRVRVQCQGCVGLACAAAAGMRNRCCAVQAGVCICCWPPLPSLNALPNAAARR